MGAPPAILRRIWKMTQCCPKPVNINNLCTPSYPQMDSKDYMWLKAYKKTVTSALPAILGWKRKMTQCCSKPVKNNTFCTPSSPQMDASHYSMLLKTS